MNNNIQKQRIFHFLFFQILIKQNNCFYKDGYLLQKEQQLLRISYTNELQVINFQQKLIFDQIVLIIFSNYGQRDVNLQFRN
ncbi:unnamed protein product (macronuclear) [Paramecium tetraurelia]|uniref:Transmembrane protein n=1 Tax=Paramecium tetraurelia TaxID=5888 RepID=A0BMF8_PARTE|nr:uncharacterized protein GSPATT00030361001 [Paramecium tetraurelia]CAK59725.1 unnamed protein product [Paramecium tetraurelia]|eukprot:XP_001427123.1 hypothetical protein (macronuclear) [Paramecium tetraurelia strain d4-2]